MGPRAQHLLRQRENKPVSVPIITVGDRWAKKEPPSQWQAFHGPLSFPYKPITQRARVTPVQDLSLNLVWLTITWVWLSTTDSVPK